MKKTILGLTFILACFSASAQKPDTTLPSAKVKVYSVSLPTEQWSAIISLLDEYCNDAKQGDIKTIKRWIVEPVNRQLFVEDSLIKVKQFKPKK